MSRLACAGLSLMLLAPLHAVAEDTAAPAVSMHRLTLEAVLTIAEGAVEQCRKKGIQTDEESA